MSTNLWPQELLKSKSSVTLPITILKEQATFLNEMTKNVITANVVTRTEAIYDDNKNVSSGVVHTLKIVAPAIGNYDFQLVRLVQKEVILYPITVISDLLESKQDAENPDELENCLKNVFTDKKTIEVIQSLLIQSNAYSIEIKTL